MDAGVRGHGSLTLQLRLIVAFALAGALLATAATAGRERDYRARAYVIRVPPRHGVAWARRGAVLRTALRIAGSSRTVPWLRDHSKAKLTGRLDYAVEVRAPSPDEAIQLATAYAKAIKRSLPPQPGVSPRGRGARTAQREAGWIGWALVGAGAGLWLGFAVAIVRRGSARAPRPA